MIQDKPRFYFSWRVRADPTEHLHVAIAAPLSAQLSDLTTRLLVAIRCSLLDLFTESLDSGDYFLMVSQLSGLRDAIATDVNGAGQKAR
jgi:hypothetical protein